MEVLLLRKEESALNLELTIAIVSLFGFLIVCLVFVFWGGQPTTLVPRPI